jgi:aerobic C4-dicarboxylate transport protein
MIIAPVIFCTVVTGIAGMKDLKKVGLVVVRIIQPGAGFNADGSTLDTQARAGFNPRIIISQYCDRHH